MNIGSNNSGISSRLSNFTRRPFVFDDVEVASMEGILQSLKFDKPHIQVEVCKLSGIGAKRRGQKRNKAWKSQQTLWWKGTVYPRKSFEYQNLLDEIYMTLYAENEKFRKDLLSTNKAVFTHSVGRHNKSETVLTETEFCSRLMQLRDNNGILTI